MIGLSPPIRFCGLFLACLAALAASLEAFPTAYGFLHLFPVSWLATQILQALGVRATLGSRELADGRCRLDLDGVDYLVTHECTGIVALFVVLAAVAAYPTDPPSKGRGLLLGLAAVTLFGALRLVVLGIVAQSRPAWIELFHVYIMELASVAFAMFVFVYWIGMTRDRGLP